MVEFPNLILLVLNTEKEPGVQLGRLASRSQILF